MEREVLLDHRKMYEIIRENWEQRYETDLKAVNWEGIQPKWMDNECKDLGWLCALNRLAVKERMYRHNCAVNAECPRCKKKRNSNACILGVWFCKRFLGKVRTFH